MQQYEWMFNFYNGGWNTVFALTVNDAIDKANQKFKGLNPIKSSFKRVDENLSEYERNLSLFW